MEAFTLDTLDMYQDLTAPGFELDDAGEDHGPRRVRPRRRRAAGSGDVR